MIKRFYILLLAIVASVGMSWAKVITWDQSKVSSMAMNVSSGSDSRTSDGITVTAVSTGEFVVFGDHGGAIEIGNGEGSGGGYLTFTSSVGNIAQIDIYHSGAGEWRNANGDWISPYYENFDGGIFTWSGTPAASITLTGDAPRHIDDITSIEFTIEDGGGSEPAAGLQVTELQVLDSWADNPTMLSTSDMPGFVAITEEEATAWDAAPAGKVDLIFAFEDNAATALSFKNGVYQAAQAHNITYEDLYAWYSNGDKIFYTSDGSAQTDDPIVIATNTEQSSYTQGSITVSVNYVGDSDGFRLNNDNSASISNSGSSTISKIELVPGWFLNKHSYVRANGAEPNSSSEELITFLNVNSNEVTLSCSVSICIKEVRIYFGEAGGGSTPTTWTSLSVGDVIKVGDKIEVPAEGDGSWGINGNVLRNTWGPYTLIRADIYQASEFDDPVVTELEDGAFYVFKAENSSFYPLSNLGKGTGLVVTGTSDGLEVTAAENKEFTVAVHDGGGSSAPANVCGDGLTWELNGGVLTISYDGVGTGEMTDFDYEYDQNPVNVAPWKENKSEITTVVIGDGVKSIGNYAFNDLYENFTAVTIANSVERIGLNAFMNAKWITEITLPSSLKTIDKECFAANFGITSITIPSGVTSIGNKAFSYCNGLTSLTCEATTPPTLGSSVFYKITSKTSDMSNIPLYVPSESVDAYTAAAQWNAFDVQAIPGGGSTDVINCTAADLGKVLCTDGSIYATVSEATAASKTAAAVIAYVDTQNGKALALALADDGGEMEWAPAKTTAPAHTPAVSNGTWTLPSKDDWDNMITAAGGYEALRDGFSAVGGTNMNEDKYWSSTPENDNAWIFYFNYGMWVDGYVDNPCRVRACLAFDIPAAPATPAYEKVMNLINEIPNPAVLTAECKAKIDAARTAYDALSDGDKDLVTNSATLTTAEAAFDNVMDIWLSGDCDVILWKDTTLTVRKHAGEGNGAMADYNYMSRAPWYNNHWYDPKPNDIVIKSVTIEEGVTHLGDYAFAWMSETKTVTIPSSVTTIPEDAFYWSKAVDDIYLNTTDPSNLMWALPYSADNQFKPEKGTNAHVPVDLLTAYQEKFGALNMTFVGDLDPITPLTPEQQQALDAVKGLINAIPSPVVYTPACKDAIDAARAAYDALTPDMLKQLVSNYATLTAAEATYANLKDVAVVEAKINAIPTPVELKLATRDSIESARAAYEALTDDQKLLVSNYQTLLDAEATWATLNPGGGMPADALNGKFTINADGDQISFAKGNLQATTEDLGEHWTWSFAANQWNYLGIAVANSKINGNGTVSENGTVDLFGWSTAATYYGINKSYKAVDYIGDFVDWGPNMGAGWRTLTKDEWNYLIENNTKGRATVNDKSGYIFLPNDWSGPAFTANPDNFTTNVYSGDDWTAMENAGAVFLPSGPARNGAYALIANDAKYSSSTSLNNDTSYVFTIYYNQSQSACTGTNRAYGCMVRLVTAGGATPLDSALAVKDLIEAIPTEITLDAACVKAIEDARAAYDALSDNAKGVLDAADVKKLTDAEQALKDLNQAVANEVIAKINNIPLPVELKLATRDSINNARAAYDALNAEQKPLVTNYQTLLDAEDDLASLNPGVPPATPLDSAQAVKDLIDAIPTPVEYPTSGAAIEAALNAYNALSDAAKGALDAADVQKLNDAAAQYAALEAIAAIEAIPAEIVYDPAIKAAIETAREKYDALSDASKELVDDEVVAKLTNAEQAWADLVAKVEHNVSYMGKDGELKNEKVALLNIPDPAPDFNGYEFVRWDVKAGDFLEEGLRVKAVYTPIITTNPQGFDTLAYNGLAQELVKAGVAKEGQIEYSLYPEESESWSAELPKATNAGVYAIYYKLVREGHADYIAPEPTMATIAKVPVTYVAPVAYDTLVYTASNQTLIAAGQTQDGTFEYSLDPTLLDSWKAELPQAMAAGTYSVYYRVKGDLNHLDSTAVDPIAVTIAKEELTATADNKNVIYGDAVPAYTVTYAGWQGDDDATVLTGEIAYACEYVKGNPVGEYVITPSGVDAANYTITFVNGKLTVNSKSAKSADITAKQADNEKLVYDAAANKPTIQAKDTTKTLVEDTDYKLTFIGRGDTEYAESATAPAHVGEYTAIVAFIGNYTDTLTVDFVINKAPLTITADDKEVTFGEFAPEFTVSYEGWQGNDTATVLTGSQAYACEYVRGNQIGDYTIIPSGVDAHDYAITFVNGTLTVNRKSAKSADITAKQADNEKLVYDAEANRPTIQVKDTTLVLTEAQDYVLTFMGVAADQTPYAESETAPTHVGDYKAIVAFIGNYIDTLTVDFTINKAPLTITANDTAMIYGDVAPAFTVSYNGWFGNDDESVILGTQAYDCVYAPGSPIGTYAITPKGVEAYDYAITFVDGTLTVNKAHVYVSGAEAQIAKFADGHANAVVLEQGILNGIKLNDPIAHLTTAAFSSADVAENLTITLFYELTGDAALLNNYNLDPTSDIFTNEGVIIEPFIPDNEDKPEDEEAEVKEGIEIYAYGYCDGSGYSLKYHLESGNPDQYKIEFEDSRFTDVDWTNLTTVGKDGTIDIEIPVDMPTGDYTMTVYFRDSRFDWLESRQLNVTFHVNLPETYVRPLFDNVIALVDTCKCLTDIQWYWRANSTELWQPIEGANGYYYHVDGKLTGEYFVSAKMNGEPTYTCGQTDMETLYGETQKASAPVVKAYPNPVVTTTTVTIENSTEWNHNIRIVNLMGAEVMNATFEGDKTSVEMGNYPQGNYLISVDGIVVKVMKQ